MPSPIRTFHMKSSSSSSKDNNPTIPIQIGELPGIVAENLGLATWGAAVVLADVLHRWTEADWTSSLPSEDLNSSIPILELGAGTALAGLAAAALWKLPAILTDLEPVLPGIEHNIRLNDETFERNGTSVQCGSLDWADPSSLGLFAPSSRTPATIASITSKARIILAADTCYTSSHPTLVSSTVSTWLAHAPSSRAVFCYPLRMAYIEHARGLWEEMEERGLVCLEEGRETSGEEMWGEVERDLPYEWSVWGWRDMHSGLVGGGS